MVLRGGYLAVALKLQEASDDLSTNDIRSRLSDAIQDAHRGTGQWAYYIDHYGDGESGDVIYSCDGDTFKAPYEISGGAGAAKCSIDMDSAVDVVPRTVYEEEQDEEGHYAAMEEAYRAQKLYASLPLYERFIAKSEREKASSDDFAGKGKSFPLLKPEDVQAAARSIGRAGSGNLGPSGIKSRIISIAKRKGWEKHLPKAWQSGGEGDKSDAKESAVVPFQSGQLRLIESTAFAADITISEALTPGQKIKLISPGKGSSAYYTEEALKKAAADKIFKAGTPMRIDHPTRAEEAARPEGSVKDWGAVLANDAVYLESYIGKNGKDYGKGLYGDYKPFSDHAQTIEEKGPYAGVSIRANGSALTEAGRIVTREGLPVLKEFTSAEGVDMVTRAGAGGLFLSEAALSANQTQEAGMTADEAKVLIQEAVAKATAPLQQRAIEGDARAEATRLLEAVTLPKQAKDRIIERSIKALPLTESGALGTEEFRKLVVAEAKAEGEYLASVTGSGRVIGMGTAPAPQIDAKEAERAAADNKRLRESAVRSYMDLGLPKAAAEAAADRDFREEAA